MKKYAKSGHCSTPLDDGAYIPREKQNVIKRLSRLFVLKL